VINVILLGIVVVLVSAAVLMWLWNITMPELFGLRRLTYWPAFRLLLIAGILMGSFHVQAPLSGGGLFWP